MFIRPVHAVARPAERPPGRPLLRGLLARGAYVWEGGEPARGLPAPPLSPAAAALAGRLDRLASLAREGLLTPEEFTAAKARLLEG
ncbi:SHOCT domain-containing protein [Streptomyces sp. G-G2]|uniref:SHOCT domain-containing protein n=1 Tax=Streptomyces sp. G-G2 TaxID=3046201 RepID=UPI0024B9388A|nr:SHOCT domain-containing protein [Streptomyces sp. G-G2]MDJ0379316.1 SHOCT domain-containing protein [Streptomyces sp. G-G2]